MKYVKSNYDRLDLKMAKGKKSELQEHSKTTGESVNGFILRAIDEAIERDGDIKAAYGARKCV